MAAITQHSKIIIKRSTTTGVVPTLGVTNDHTDGTWSATDIYVGEFFYNVIDNRLWIGKVGGVQEIPTAQLFELTYAEAFDQKDINGSPAGDGLIIGALYKITDKGDNGIILQAIDLDKFSFYGDELIASPEEHRACIYDFDADLLTYPSGANYKVYTALLTQTGTNAPTAVVLENTLGTISFAYSAVGGYNITSSSLFTLNKTFFIITNNSSLEYALIYTYSNASTLSITISDILTATGLNDLLLNTPIEIRVYN